MPELFTGLALSGTCRRITCEVDRPVRRSRRHSRAASAFLQRYGAPFDRSGAYDPDADHRLLRGHSLRAPALRRGSPQPGVSLVLPARPGRFGARSLDLLQERHGRFRDSDLLRRLFEDTVARCIADGLDGGEGFAVYASMIRADANRQNSTPGDEWEPPDDPGHAVREYLAVLDEAAFGGATPVMPRFISTADPASRWTGANGGLAFFAYCTNYLIDLKHAVIMDVEATTAVG